MDVKSLAERLDQMPIFPYFTLCHIIVCTLNTRSDLGSGSLYFSRKHPLACWISTLLCTFSGTILANFLLNEPVISALGNTQQVLWATTAWYLIFYSPFDVVYRICKFIPLKLILYCMSEIYNCKATHQGIIHASKIFPESYVAIAFIGIVRGNGQGFTKLLERLIRGTWSLSVHEFLNPSFTTKMSAIASVVFIINKYTDWLRVSQSLVFFCVACTNMYFRLSSILLDLSDPFSPFEKFICLIFFGGIWDAIAKAIMLEEQRRQAGFTRARAMKADILSKSNKGPSDGKVTSANI